MSYLIVALKAVGALLIGYASCLLFYRFVWDVLVKQYSLSNKARILYVSYVLMAFELFLGAGLLTTLASPSWSDIGKLVAIAVLRTVLKYALKREMNYQQKQA